MEKSIKGQMRDLRRACKDVGMKPGNNESLKPNEFPVVGSFSVSRAGKPVNADDVQLGDEISIVVNEK